MSTSRHKLKDIATALGMTVGCGDNSCVWGSQGGMGTNGGCRCYGSRGGQDYRIGFLQMAQVARHLVDVYNVLNPKKDKPVSKLPASDELSDETLDDPACLTRQELVVYYKKLRDHHVAETTQLHEKLREARAKGEPRVP